MIDHVINDYETGHNCKYDSEYKYYENFKVVCPICSTRPGGNPNFLSSHFIGHLHLRHGLNLE